MEEWKSLNFLGYPNYAISSLGRVKNVKTGRIKKLKGDGNGYLKIVLCDGKGKMYRVHRLVALAFIPNPENKPHVDHINTIKDDNRVENLRWVTRIENFHNPISESKHKTSMSSEDVKNKLSVALSGHSSPFKGTTGRYTHETLDRIAKGVEGNKNIEGRIWITNGEENRMIYPEELQEFYKNGYYRGITRH